MAAHFTPHWVEDPLHGPKSPGIWILYIVTQIDGRHRPLAVVHRGEPSGLQLLFETVRGRDLIISCLRIIAIFSDPANRLAIQSEIAIATAFYQDSENLPLAPVELLEQPKVFCETWSIAPFFAHSK
jgi:hypothetical protein